MQAGVFLTNITPERMFERLLMVLTPARFGSGLTCNDLRQVQPDMVSHTSDYFDQLQIAMEDIKCEVAET